MKIRELGVLLIMVSLIFAISFFSSCSNLKIPSGVSKNIIAEELSDACSYKAVKLKVGAGATTRYSYHLVIVDKHENLSDESHTVFVSYSDFDFFWKNDNLIVKIMDKEKIFKQEKIYKNVNILYETN